MVEGCEQPTALQSHLVPFAISLLVSSDANPDGGPNWTHLVSAAAIVERRMALIGRSVAGRFERSRSEAGRNPRIENISCPVFCILTLDRADAGTDWEVVNPSLKS